MVLELLSSGTSDNKEGVDGVAGVKGVFGVGGTSAASFESSPLLISKLSKSSTSLSGSCFVRGVKGLIGEGFDVDADAALEDDDDTIDMGKLN